MWRIARILPGESSVIGARSRRPPRASPRRRAISSPRWAGGRWTAYLGSNALLACEPVELTLRRDERTGGLSWFRSRASTRPAITIWSDRQRATSASLRRTARTCAATPALASTDARHATSDRPARGVYQRAEEIWLLGSLDAEPVRLWLTAALEGGIELPRSRTGDRDIILVALKSTSRLAAAHAGCYLVSPSLAGPSLAPSTGLVASITFSANFRWEVSSCSAKS